MKKIGFKINIEDIQNRWDRLQKSRMIAKGLIVLRKAKRAVSPFLNKFNERLSQLEFVRAGKAKAIAFYQEILSDRHSNLRLKAERVLKIEREDWPTLLVMLFLLLFVNIGIMAGNISTQSLFVTEFGKEYIPWMFFFDSFGLFIISIFITSFVDRMNKVRLFRYTLVIFAVIIIGFRAMMWIQQPIENTFNLRWSFIYPLFFIAEYIFKIILFGQFWLVANEICDTRQSKRIFGLISSGGIIGAILSSFSIPIVLNLVQTADLYFVWAGALIAAAFIATFIPKLGLSKEMRQTKKLFTNLDEQFQDIEVGYIEAKGSKLLKTLGLLIVLCFALSYTLDYEFLATLSERFKSADSLTSFIAKVKGLASFTTLLMQVFFTNRILSRLKVHNSMLILPGTYIIGFLSLGIFFHYSVASVVVFLRDVIFFAVYNPSYQMMYSPISEKNRGRAKSFIEGIGNPLALFSAFMLLSGFTEILSDRWLGFFASLIGILFWQVARRLKKAYEDALISDLRRDDFNIREVAKSTIREMEGVDLQKILYKSLVDGDKDTAIFATEMLQKSGNTRSVNALFFALRRSKDVEVRLKLLETIGILGDKSTARLMLPYLKSKEKDIQIAALRTLINIGDESSANFILSLLRLRDPDIRATAASVLWYLGDERGQQVLDDMLKSNFDDIRRSATLALSQVSNDRMGKNLISILQDDNYEVRKYAIIGLGKIKFSESIPNLVEALSDKMEDVRTAAQMSLPNFDAHVIEPLMKKFRENSHSANIQRRVIHILGEIQSVEAEDCLFNILNSSDGILQELTLHSLGKRKQIRRRDLLRTFVLKQISKIYQQFFYINILQPYKKTTSGDALITFLEEDNRHKKDRILQALGLIEGDINTFYLIQKKLKSTNKYLRANAIETLENLAGRGLFHRLLPLIETPDNIRIRQALKGARGETMSDPTNIVRQLLLPPFNPLIRSCAAYLAGETKNRKLLSILNVRRDNDPDPLVAENAGQAVERILLKSTLLTQWKDPGMLTLLEKIFFLKKVPMFSNMSGEELRLIANICTEKTVAMDEVIMKEKEYQEDVYLYIVTNGLVSLTNMTPSGEEKILKILKVKDYFGDIEVFDDQGVASVTVRAMEETRLMRIGQKEINNLLLEYPSIAIEICKVFSTKLRQVNRLLVINY